MSWLLKSIVQDIEANRSILLCDLGFQAGAAEAAVFANVWLTSLGALQQDCAGDPRRLRLADLCYRLNTCRNRYFLVTKDRQVELDLRRDVGQSGYSDVAILALVSNTLKKAVSGHYPFKLDTMYPSSAHDAPTQFRGLEEVVAYAEPMLTELEAKLAAYELPPQPD